MPYSPTSWTDSVTPVNAANLNKIEAGLVATAAGYGTSLPASPVDGQEAILVDSTTNPSYQWRFRYNAGSSSAYKWEFVGGAEANAFAAGTGTTTSVFPTWADIAGGPSFVVPRAGDYTISFTCHAYHSVAGGAVLVCVAPSLAAIPVEAIMFSQCATALQQVCAASCHRQVGLSAGATLAMRYSIINAGTVTVERREMMVAPVRVS